MTLARTLAAAALALLCAALPAHAEDQLNVNAAGAEELEKLPGVGETTAKRIVEFRETNGPFGSVDDLQKVRGVSAAMIEKLRAFLYVGPAAGSGRARAETITAARADDAGASNVKKLLARYKDEPGVREVQEAATRFAEVHPEIIQSWRARARVAGLGPQVRTEYRYVGQDNLTNRTGGDSPPTQTTVNGNEYRPLVRAQWDLDRLVFNPDELRVSNEIVDLVRLRESVLDQVTKVYYERRRLQVELELTPPTDLAGRVRKELRLQELVADLDALTGGFFSRKLAERGLDPY